MKYDIKDIKLATEGKRKIDWAAREMGVLDSIETRFKKQKPFKDVTIAACLHVTTETARLMQVLKAGGAQVVLCASNPLSTQDEIAASLVKHDKISVFAVHGANRFLYYKHLKSALELKPHITMDDGADLLALVHTTYKKLLPSMIGSTEETTTGVIRLRAMEQDNALKLPVIAVNDAQTKHLFDNRYGTGQSTIDGIIRATNVLIAGKTVVVAGYGWCGKGVAMRAKGLGAKVVVTEVDPVRALEAVMDGFSVMTMKSAAAKADIIITVTGDRDVIDKDTLKVLKNECIIANSGHFDVEIDVASLKKMAKKTWQAREHVQAFELPGKRVVNLLTDGRLVNLAAAEGHPSAVMDTSFAGQALASEYLIKQKGKLKNVVNNIPKEIDEHIASIKLASLGIKYDKLTPKQQKYLSSWGEGT
jgi:adenosylhomocysteinase